MAELTDPLSTAHHETRFHEMRFQPTPIFHATISNGVTGGQKPSNRNGTLCFGIGTLRGQRFANPHERHADAIRRMLYFARTACRPRVAVQRPAWSLRSQQRRCSPASRSVHGATMCQPHGGTHMQWTTPSYTDMRFGFEITMYIATR
ncbi:UNVERIFIED_ORG: coenzyme PQQ precursor peptide PqqA [Burkholderia sp. 1595]|uniref:Coenzyme PQQ synthesis protein A n=10 Tax=Burkholderiaceae TaxID=119060 RepID=A0ABU1LJJ9_9BURK|nr:coenzyme PQQ precursor peptide PqqA [Paraburkholderia terricola]MDR6479444.1 coenzyme PQQ precursor peptide PqqA [Paraburkholderia terricola]